MMAEGALRDIRAGHPGAEIVVLTRPAYRRLLARCPWVDRVLVEPAGLRSRPGRLLAFWAALRREGFARVYDLQNNRRTAFWRRFLLPGRPWSRLPALPPAERAPERKPSILERFAGQLAAAGLAVVHTPNPRPDWMAEPAGDVLAAAGLAGPYVLLIPGSSAKHPHKRWPHYGALATALAARGYAVATAPGPDELDLCRALPAHLLAEADGRPLDWFRLAGVLQGAALVVGNDTGPLHLAVHLGRPTLALFGAHTTPRRVGLPRPGVRVLGRPDLADLPPGEVLEAALEVLAR
ncbi:MAG: glycosyltransferase family 9 protein [Tistlia sp.]|uniref:glycosyltransferase family 9 protein n=1 Tax=Tistlia sp. TaxID=3057121 RepID=UPI0034A3F4D2